jgi:predicted nuclease with RNAse H fold
LKLVGIDLAASPQNCGVCVLRDDTVEHVGCGSKFDEHPDWIVGHCARADVVAVDVPFGWPKPFIKALAGYEIGAALNRDRKPYLRRITDVFVTEALPDHLRREAKPPNPMAVAADKLGVTAMVGTILLNALSSKFRLSPRESGVSQAVVEVYPAASLWAWGLSHKGFKGSDEDARNRRSEILEKLKVFFGLEVAVRDTETLVRSDHCFDALVATLTAREYTCSNTFDPPEYILNEIPSHQTVLVKISEVSG